MRTDSPKDLFVVHTKSMKRDRLIVDAIAALLLPHGFKIWGYADWRWQVKQAYERTWDDTLQTHGFLDPEQELAALNGPQPRFPAPVDRAKLDELLLKTRAIMFLATSRDKLSHGMREEVYSLNRLQRLRRQDKKWRFPPPACIWCTTEGQNREPCPLNMYGDGDVSWSGTCEIQITDAKVATSSSIALMVMLTALLLEQRAAFVRQLETQPRNTHAVSHFFCGPEDELQRCAQVLRFAKEHSDPVAGRGALGWHLGALETLLSRYNGRDLDWSRWAHWDYRQSQ